nr:hypothetical protein BaRGS_023688 [Batillaria attramentaria]
MAAGTDVSPLVPCDWLKEKIAAGDLGNIVLLDVSWSSQKDCYEDYKQRHIPGAVFFNVMVGPHTDLFPRNLPTPEVFQDLTRAAGVNDDSHVILYSDSDNCGFFMSGRAWWTFTMFGAKKVSILNGGLQRWLTLGYPTTSEVPTVKRGNFTARYDSQHRLTFEEMTQRIASGATIADSRPAKSYAEGILSFNS